MIAKETKSGVLTSEFWLSIATMLAVLTDVVPLPERYEGYVIGAVTLAYALARGLAKNAVPSEVVVAGTMPSAEEMLEDLQRSMQERGAANGPSKAAPASVTNVVNIEGGDDARP